MLKRRNRIWLHVSTVSFKPSYLSTDLILELDGRTLGRLIDTLTHLLFFHKLPFSYRSSLSVFSLCKYYYIQREAPIVVWGWAALQYHCSASHSSIHW